MPLIIRPLTKNDKPQWLPLWQGYLSFYKAAVPEDVTEQTWARLIGADGHHGFVCVDQKTDQLVGFTHYLCHNSTWQKNGYCYLEDLFVSPDCRSGGAGRLLIEAVREAATKAGISRLYWHTDENNITARKLYDKVAVKSDFIQYRIEH